MSTSNVRAKFATIYQALPEDAKRALLEEQLLPLIDGLSTMGQMKLLSVAESAQSRYVDMPRLDLAAKTAEVDALFEELKRDSTRSASSSHREEIVEEIVDSLASWLSDIWQVVYEYGIDFERGHECLLFSSRALHQVNTTGSGCKCGFMNMYVPVTIKDRSGKTVKHFSYSGAHFLEDAFLWIWRDMLLRMLAEGNPRDVSRIPQMLQDIQSANMAWASLDRILVAGGKIPPYGDDGDTDYEEEDDDDDDVHCVSHAAHWSASLHAQLPALRHHISDSLFATFKLTPSLALYTSIISLTPATLSPLLAHLRTAVLFSGAAAAAALDIHALNADTTSLITVLDAARPVLRPRDAPAMQSAVHFLSDTKHAAKALEVVSRELHDCVEIMRGLIVSSAFGGIDTEDSRDQLAEVLKLRINTTQRQERVERWVDSVATGPPPSGNPLTFAAFLMGFPPGFEPDDTEEPDPFNLFNGIKEGDPEYEDLRDEWRPRLKERFESWVSEAEVLKPGGPALLVQLAKTISDTMPYTRGSDIIDEMIARIQDKPPKYHICDALDALSLFMKAQRKKMLAEKHKAERRKNAIAAGKKSKQGGKRTAAGEASGSGSGSGGAHAGASTHSGFSESQDDEDMPPLEHIDDTSTLEHLDDMPTLEPFDAMPSLEALD